MYKLIILTMFCMNLSFADECPISPLKVKPKVKVDISYDKKSALYTYSYEVENEQDALLPIFTFRIMIDSKPDIITFPEKSKAYFYDLGSGEEAPFPKNFLIKPLPEGLKPGSRSGKYVIKSKLAPGMVKYFSEGIRGLAIVTPNEDNDEPEPKCEGLFLNQPYIEGMVNGFTFGPVSTNQISINFKLKKMKKEIKGKGYHESTVLDVFDFKNETKIMAILTSDKDLDVKKIDISSIRLGTSGASVEASSLIADKKNEKLKMIFDVNKIGLICERDRVLFLTGKTQDSKFLLGAEPIKIINCPNSIKMK